MPNSPDSKTKKVAVIAVHGVSDQQPFDSARQVANLLINPETRPNDQYTPFLENFIRIPVDPIKINPIKIENQPIIPDERGEFIHQRIKKEIADKPINGDVDIDLTQDYLSQYQQSTVYETIFLEGDLKEHNSSTKVHVYEIYWGDLSRLGTGFIRIFGELYQLLFHLISIGRPVVDLARINIRENQELSLSERKLLDKQFMSWGRWQLWTGRFLSLGIPTLNIFLLLAAFLSVPVNIIDQQLLPILFGTIIALLLCLAIGFLFYSKRKKDTDNQNFLSFFGLSLFSFLLPFTLGLLGALFSIHLFKWTTFGCYIVLCLVLFLILGIPYERHRPGFLKVASLICLIITISAICLIVLHDNSSSGMTIASLQLVEITYLLLVLSWAGFLFSYFTTIYQGLKVLCSLNNLTISNSKELIDSFEKVFRVSILTLSLPATLFVFITLALWSALNYVGSSLIQNIEPYNPIIFKGLNNFSHKLDTCKDVATLCSDSFLQLLNDYSASPLAILSILFFALTLLVIILTLLPAILMEVFPPNNDDENSNYSKNLGKWLNQGFEITITTICIAICIVIPLLYLISLFLSLSYWFGYDILPHKILGLTLEQLLDITRNIQLISSLLLTASAGSLIAFGAQLNKISLGLRGVLDAALDVDNYLRLYPRDDNPRARIFARYFSLLKYICNPQDSTDSKDYDAIIIVSHSQGTVISADILRLLKYYESDLTTNSWLGENAKIPNIYLFTMGSPIRQLYNFAFPDLYNWVQNNESVGIGDSHDDINPDPSKLFSVKQWVNAYRSGDYIGRYLWRSPENPNLWQKVKFSSNSDSNEENIFLGKITNTGQVQEITMREFCIGVGGHTHYWDETAPEIAHELDRLIREAKKNPT